ncbi:hypothetical protein [Lentzea guizhouensis]|uniref:hypothetical protein n=1 Tax=Lentzea guizhouensis TaxID=1586287 RepID=UPI001C54DC26|nr:hypothetical protein [Lentzea guizhouensis]
MSPQCDQGMYIADPVMYIARKLSSHLMAPVPPNSLDLKSYRLDDQAEQVFRGSAHAAEHPHGRGRPRVARRSVRTGGHVALTCFTADEGTRWIFQDLVEVELRRMTDEPVSSAEFGRSFLWTAPFRRPIT